MPRRKKDKERSSAGLDDDNDLPAELQILNMHDDRRGRARRERKSGNGSASGEEEDVEEEERGEDNETAKAASNSVPEVNERYFVPASLWPDEKAKKTPHGKGWLATVLSVSSAAGKKRKKTSGANEETVSFKCDGEKETVSMTVAAFRKKCKPIEA